MPYVLVEEQKDGSHTYANNVVYDSEAKAAVAREELEGDSGRNIMIIKVPEGSKFE
jgi:hypothetical protein